jgi:hypothetical protein
MKKSADGSGGMKSFQIFASMFLMDDFLKWIFGVGDPNDDGIYYLAERPAYIKLKEPP